MDFRPSLNKSATLYGVTGSTNVTKVNTDPANPGFPVVIRSTQRRAGPKVLPVQVFNSASSGFQWEAGCASAHFMFANLNGTISAWDTWGIEVGRFDQATTPGAIYTGLALSLHDWEPLLYAANNAGTGSINVFNSTFAQAMNLPAGAFATPATISAMNLVPFNVQVSTVVFL